jgi:hypothetical protein
MKRLYDQDQRLDFLTDHDLRVLRFLRRNYRAGAGEPDYVFDIPHAIPALIGHPALFDARDRKALELFDGPAELLVMESGDGYRLRLSHPVEADTVILEAESPTRYRVIQAPPPVVTVEGILGRDGLGVPKSGCDRVLALLRTHAPLLPIRADVAAAGLPDQLGITTP